MWQEYLELVITTIVDAIEDFFESLVVPTASFVREAFLVSLAFIPVSVMLENYQLISFVSWQEAVTCSIILLIITLVDSTSRGQLFNAMKVIKSTSSNAIGNVKSKMKSKSEIEEEVYEYDGDRELESNEGQYSECSVIDGENYPEA